MKRQFFNCLPALAASLLLLPSCNDTPTHFFEVILRKAPEETITQEETMTQQEFFRLLPSLIKNSAFVEPSSGTPEPGMSKIGGIPDLPADFEWPTYYGKGVLDSEKALRPLSFMAQINLEEVHPYDTDGLLPENGMLYFFYEMETMCWGFDPDDKGCCRVYYAADGTELIPTPLPETLDPAYHIPEYALIFHSQPSAPSFGEIEEEYSIRWESDEPWQTYSDELSRLGIPEVTDLGTNCRLLGYPELIQNPIWQECELASSGIYTGRGFPPMTDSEKADLAQRSEEWMLLFQMGSVGDIMFGDVGSIFFCIRKQDLAALDFENVWLILQCG